MITIGAEEAREALDAWWPTLDGAFAINESAADGLAKFTALVSLWGRKTDLVSGKNIEALLEVLFLDAAYAAHLIPPHASFVDIGAGAGAPAIPLAILLPNTHACLVEPRRKRVAFMRHAVGALGLQDRVRVIEGRDTDLHERFDLAFSRATFEPSEWLQRAHALSDLAIVCLSRMEANSESFTLEEQRAYSTKDGVPREVRRYRAK